MIKKIALIVGVTGQDGSLLSQFLLKKKYFVIGTTTSNKIGNLTKLGIEKNILIIHTKKYDKNFFVKLFNKYNIAHLYYFSGQSSVAKSDILRFETIESNTKPLADILEVLRIKKSKIKILNAVSSEMFGNKKNKINETTVVNPQSFYGLAKSLSFEISKTYREQFKLNICNLILFNHESKLRPNYFIIKKIINEIKKLKTQNKVKKKLVLGNLNIQRDWGWAPEYIKLIYKIANSKFKEDFVIATGKTHKLSDVVKKIFDSNQLSINKNIVISKKFIRSNEILANYANIGKIKRYFKWKPKFTLKKIINELQKK